MIVLYVVLAFLWWKSAEIILINGWTREQDLHRIDRLWLRFVAVCGPAIAAIIWLAWLWAELPEPYDTPIKKRRIR